MQLLAHNLSNKLYPRDEMFYANTRKPSARHLFSNSQLLVASIAASAFNEDYASIRCLYAASMFLLQNEFSYLFGNLDNFVKYAVSHLNKEK